MTFRGRPLRMGQVVLVAVTFVFCVGLAALPLRTWYGQRAELGEAESRRAELQQLVDESDARIAAKTDEDGIRRDAKCLAHFVEPGAELYTVPGVDGCVEGSDSVVPTG